MTHPSTSLADAFGSLRSAAQRDAAAARTRLSGVLEALFLTLLATLFGRLERILRASHPADMLPGDHDSTRTESDRILRRIALGLPAVSSSHHADLAALGLLPGWIMRGFPARGMRPVPPRRLSPRHLACQLARAPHAPIRRDSSPVRGRIRVSLLLRYRNINLSPAPPPRFILC